MRMVHAIQENTTEGAQQVKQTGVGGDAKIVYALLTGMVSDKVVYPVREYATNAWEVSPAGRPPEIELPTRFNPQFTIRDFGPGLPHRFMMDRYAKIGESTKDGDDDAVGGWGFGSKAALAYLMRSDGAGSFTVTSRFRGFRRVYIIGVSEQGKIQIQFLGEWPLEPEDRGTGLEISFPVRPDDIQRFHDHAKAVYWSFEPRPRLSPAIDFGTPHVLSQGDGWTVYHADSVPFYGPQVMLGPVMYPIDPDLMPATDMITAETCIVFKAQIGTISVSASREALQYDDRTEAGLRALFAAYAADWLANARKQVDACSTYFEARWRAMDVAGTLPSKDYGWRLAEQIGWRGFAFHADLFPDGGRVKAARWPEMRGKNYVPGAPVPFRADWGINPGELQDRTIVVQYNTSRSMERLAAAGLADSKLLWVRCKRADLAYALERMGRPDYVLLDSIKLPKQTRGPREKRPESVKRRRVMCLRTLSTYSDFVDHDDELLYVRIDGRGKRMKHVLTVDGQLQEFGNHWSPDLLGHLNTMRACGLDDKIGADTTCVVVGQDEAPQEHWVSLGDHLVELLDEAIDPAQVAPIVQWGTHSFPEELRQIVDRGLDLGMAPQELRDLVHSMAAMNKTRQAMTRDDNDHDRLAAVLLEIAGTDLKSVAKDPTQPIKQGWAAFTKEYPLFHVIFTHADHVPSYKNSYKMPRECQRAVDNYFILAAK